MKNKFSYFENIGNDQEGSRNNLKYLMDTHRKLRKAVRKFLKAAVIGQDYYLDRLLSQEGHIIHMVGPEGVKYEDSEGWSDKNFHGMGIENMLNIIRRILDGTAKGTPELPERDMAPELLSDRNYSLMISGIPVAVLTKGPDMKGRLYSILRDQYCTNELWIVGFEEGEVNDKQICIAYRREEKREIDRVNIRPVPLY